MSKGIEQKSVHSCLWILYNAQLDNTLVEDIERANLQAADLLIEGGIFREIYTMLNYHRPIYMLCLNL